MKIVVVIDGKRNGPHEPEAVKALYDSGDVGKDTEAWKEGMSADFKPLSVVWPELFSVSPGSPTVTPPLMVARVAMWQ